MDPSRMPIITAIRNGELDVAEHLVHTMVGPNITMLQVASDSGFVDVVKLLLEKGSDVNGDPDNIGTPLRIAILKEHKAVVKLLLENGATIYERAVHDAFDRFDIATVKLLLEFGANPNVVNRNGDSPLCRACDFGVKEVVDLLLTRNCRINQANLENETPLQIAIQCGKAEIASSLLKRGAIINSSRTPLHMAARDSNGDVINVIVQHEYDNYSGDFTDLTKLWDDPAFVEDKLKRDSIINQLGGRATRTALLTAIAWGNDRVIKALLANGASIDINSKEVLQILSMLTENQGSYQMQPVIMHILKMLAANMRVNDSVIKAFHNITSTEQYFESLRTKHYDEFVKDVNRLKDEIAFDTLTYYDVLKMDTDHLATYAKNPKLIEIVKNKSYNKFENYSMFFEQKFQETVVRRALLDMAHEVFSNIFRILPYSVIRRILYYLSNDELRKYRVNNRDN